MKKYLISVYAWESPRIYVNSADFQAGEKVVVASDFGSTIGTVLVPNAESKEESFQEILRLATPRDIEAFEENEKRKEEILKTTKSEVKRLDLGMKIIDVRISLDGSSVVIIFTADGRVDFRELVKNLARIFHRSVKMHQIGSRDEARRIGGCGVCGRDLCCVRFPGNLPSITTEMARVQQVAHRGSERISGLCGRLLCCLAYEADQYRELLKGMPELRSSIKTDKGKGEVLEINVVKQEVKIRLEDGNIISVTKAEIK